MKTSLMLWDRVHVIAPFDNYRPYYDDPELQEAFDLIGQCYHPSRPEKKQAHELVEDFATRGLPDSFSYASVISPSEVYEVYPQKLLPETWDLLVEAGLAGRALSNQDYPTSGPTGLSLMSLLADCCAGKSLARITDRSAAYASLASLFTNPIPVGSEKAADREALLAISLKIADSEKLPLSRWLKLRKREIAAADGHHVRDLRHRFVAALEKQAAELAEARSQAERLDIQAGIEQDMQDDWKDLHEALKLEAWQMLPTKEVLVSVLSGIGAFGSLALNNLPMPEVISSTGAMASIGGLLASRSKYVKARRKVLQDHPIAYLYESQGGLRL